MPEPATVRATDDTLYVLDAPLTVKSQHLDTTDPRTGKPTCPGQTKEQADYNEALANRLLVPEMTKRVNDDPEYAALRRVYLSRVVAQWYREISAQRTTLFKPLIGDGWVAPYWPDKPWDPKTGWNEYIKEYAATHGTLIIDGQTYNVEYGGVDFSTAPETPMAAQQFSQSYPSLPRTVDRSITKPAHDPGTDATYAGGVSTIPVHKGGSGAGQGSGPVLPVTGTPLWPSLLVGLGLLLAGVLLRVLVRHRRTRAVS